MNTESVFWGFSYAGSLWHHGVKGQKWGVRRTPEELGHARSGAIDKSAKKIKIENGYMISDKGFTVHRDKLTKFCLSPGAKHSDHFFKAGYKEDDTEKLFRDLEAGFDVSKAVKEKANANGDERWSIPMELGSDADKRMFTTIWSVDGSDNSKRFITAYIDRKLKKRN